MNHIYSFIIVNGKYQIGRILFSYFSLGILLFFFLPKHYFLYFRLGILLFFFPPPTNIFFWYLSLGILLFFFPSPTHILFFVLEVGILILFSPLQQKLFFVLEIRHFIGFHSISWLSKTHFLIILLSSTPLVVGIRAYV